MDIREIQKLSKSQPDLYGILWSIWNHSTSNKSGIQTILTHRDCKILFRYINKLDNKLKEYEKDLTNIYLLIGKEMSDSLYKEEFERCFKLNRVLKKKKD